MSGRCASRRDAVAAVVGVEHLHAVQLERAGQREDVADVVVDDQHRRARRAGRAPRRDGAGGIGCERRTA